MDKQEILNKLKSLNKNSTLMVEPLNNNIIINQISLSNNDYILITYDIDQCDIDTAKQIYDNFVEMFPNNIIIANPFPLVKSIDIIKPEEKESINEDYISW
jgi:hypothetical protein